LLYTRFLKIGCQLLKASYPLFAQESTGRIRASSKARLRTIGLTSTVFHRV
jgi:hypothetical protein